jgi:hypothetical protein
MNKLGVITTLIFLGLGVASGQTPLKLAASEEDIREMLATLQEERNFKAKPIVVADAIIRLGDAKVVDAIPMLIAHIDFVDPRERQRKSKAYSVLKGRVAVQALISIGRPSIGPVLEATKQEDRRLRLICMAAVLSEVHAREGSPPQEVSGLVDAAIEEAKDPTVKGRLQKVKEFVLRPPIH